MTICLIINIILIIKQALTIILNSFFCPHNVIITVTHTLINIYNFFMHIVCAQIAFVMTFSRLRQDSFFSTPFCIVVCVHLSYCFLIFDHNQFSSCHEKSHNGKDIFFHQFLSSSLSRTCFVVVSWFSVEICWSGKEWQMTLIARFKNLPCRSDKKILEYLQFYFKKKNNFIFLNFK